MTKTRWGSLGLALLVLVALVLWMASGEVNTALEEVQPPEPVDAGVLARVLVDERRSRWYQPHLQLQGQIQPWRQVTVGARVSATVEELLVNQGERVSAGTSLLRLSKDNRPAEVARWQARARKLESDLEAANRLGSNHLASRSEILGAETELASARAELKQAQLALENLTPKAPFNGIVNRRLVELGDLVQVGDPLLELVQVERLKARGQIPQQSVVSVAEGQAVSVELLDGRRLEGRVSFVASAADPATRSFAVEIAVDNPDGARVAGGSATLRIALPEVQAMFISPAHLSLGDDGRPGVRHVDGQNRVAFTTVKLLNVTTDGAWVSGLPDEIRLITRGGGFVSIGQEVQPVDQSDNRG